MSRGSVLVLGGTSDIGLAIARRFAQAGYVIRLAARRPEALVADRSDIELRYGTQVTVHPFDVLADAAAQERFLDNLPELPDVVVCVVGVLGEQGASERDPEAATLVMRSNYEGPAIILSAIANRFEQRDAGTIVGISSVAGDRGRASNYFYGSAKAGFTAFLSGLRNRLSRGGVRVITVKPGFVATRMTEGLKTPAPLLAQPRHVADAVFRAVERGGDVIYVAAVWRLIMLIIRGLPEPIFKRTNF